MHRVTTSGRFLLIIFLYFSFFVTAVFVHERPYHLSHVDGEANYYYNAALIAIGQPPSILTHPGVSQYYLGGGLLRALGFNESHIVSHTQYYLHTMHILGFAIVVTCWLISWLLLKRSYSSHSTSLAFLFCFLNPVLFAWCLDYYGPETMIMALTPLLMSVFLIAITRPPSWAWSIALGAISAVALDAKVSMAVIVLPILASYLVYVLTYSRSVKQALVQTALISGVLVGVVGALLATIWPLMPEVSKVLFLDRQLAPQDLKTQLQTLQSNVVALWLFSPWTLYLFVGLLIAIGFWWTLNFIKTKKTSRNKNDEIPSLAYKVSIGCFLFLLLAGWIYIFQMPRVPESDLYVFGLYFRNPLMLYLATPFLLLPIAGLNNNKLSRILSSLPIFIICLIAVGLYAISCFDARKASIEKLSAKTHKFEHFFYEQSEKNRIGVYYDHATLFFPTEFLFHYRGSYIYGGSYFDSIIDKSYPFVSHFDLPNIDLFQQHQAPTPESHYKSRTGGLSERTSNPYHPKHFSNPFQLLSGKETPLPEKIIINENLEFMNYRVFERLVKVIQERYDLSFSKTQVVDDIRFYIFDKKRIFTNSVFVDEKIDKKHIRFRGSDPTVPPVLAEHFKKVPLTYDYKQDSTIPDLEIENLISNRTQPDHILVDLMKKNFYYTKNFYRLESSPHLELVYMEFPHAIFRLLPRSDLTMNICH